MRTPTSAAFEKRIPALFALVLFCALSVIGPARATDIADQEFNFDIPAQSLTGALLTFSAQTGLQVVTSGATLPASKTSAVAGRQTIASVLGQLLSGTGLKYKTISDTTITLVPEGRKTTSAGRDIHLARSRTTETQNAGQDAAPGDAADKEAIQEITVTAQKREERAQDVPISIAVISSQEIERRGLVGMEDYLRSIPGVNQIDRGVNDNAIVVRGITTAPQGENFSSGPTVATYFGETPITGLGGYLVGGIDVRPVDLERIEMLRGPQGTTFGSASLAGALRLIPKAPVLNRFGAQVAAAYSETSGLGSGNNTVQAVANVPIVEDRFGLRAVGYRYDESGYYRNSVGLDPASLAIANRFGVGNLVGGFVKDDIGSSLTTGGRIAALWRATDSLRIAFNVLTQKIEQHGLPLANLGQYDQANPPVAPIRRVDGDPREYIESNIDLYNIVTDYDLSWATWTSTASWADGGVSPLVIALGSPFPFTNATYMDVDSFTAETRMTSHLAGRFQFTAGLFYEDTDNPNVQYADWLGTGVAPNPLPTLNPLAPVTDPLAIIRTNRNVKQRAIFGELSYNLTDQITATVGGRYFNYDKQEYRLEEGGTVGRPFGTGVPTNARNDENNHTLKANISYKPLDEALIYASWSQGFRLGRPTPGVSPGLCDVNPSDGLIDGTSVTIASTRIINSDFLDSSEIGAKFALFDRRMTVDLAAYHSKWDGLPVQASLPQTGTCRGSYIANVGGATSDGAEIQAKFVVVGGLQLTAGGGYTKAELSKDAPGITGQPKAGARLPGAPHLNANLGAQYDFRIAGHKAFVRVDSFYTGEFYGDLLETPGLRAGEYIKVDARAGIAFGPLSAELFARNLTNQDDFTWRGLSGGANPFFGYRLRPRTVGLQLGYRFE